MDIRTEKLSIIQRLLQVHDESLIWAIQRMLDYALKDKEGVHQDFWEELTPAQKEKIEEAIRQINEGEGIPHDLVMEEFKTKYRK